MMLRQVSYNGTTWTNTYDVNGLRAKREGGGKTYSYTYNGSLLSRMTVGDDTLTFFYDASGNPLSLMHNGTTYYYATNLQGDVVALLNTSGTAVVTYTYDAWGKLLETGGSMASTLGALNPLRYRGYVYDTETGLYYLQSRYYSPAMGRFINGDDPAYLGVKGLLSYNLFAYCNNNPVMGYDPSGYVNEWGVFAGVLLIIAGVGCIAATGGAATPAGAALLMQAGVMLGATGYVTTKCAAQEAVMVIDVSASDPVTSEKKGASLVIDFEESSFDLYGHYGQTVSKGGSPITYAVGTVYNYEDSGDYSGAFVNAGGSVHWIGGDYCRSPDLDPKSCYAQSITFGLPGTKGAGAYVGADYFYQIAYWE